ncbi:MAG TPA: phosphotransferase [Chthonomonadales bacterium]|nr:phosphotransferase [Chthonomonadales bacterium]
MDDEQIAAYVAEALGIRARGADVVRLGGRQGMVVARVVLRGRGSWVFKAVRRVDRREVALSAAVGAFASGLAPVVLGCEVDERRSVSWIVMQDAGDVRLRDRPDGDSFAAAADALASVQLASLPHVDDLASRGVPRVGLREWEDVALEVLERVSTVRAHAIAAEMTDVAWAAVAAARVAANLPVALVHGDLHAGNVALRDGSPPCLLDWGSAYLGSAFLGFEELAVASTARMHAPDIEGRARAAYLRRWAPLLGKPGPLEPSLLACRLLLRLEVARQALRGADAGRGGEIRAAAAYRLAVEALRQWRKAALGTS